MTLLPDNGVTLTFSPSADLAEARWRLRSSFRQESLSVEWAARLKRCGAAPPSRRQDWKCLMGELPVLVRKMRGGSSQVRNFAPGSKVERGAAGVRARLVPTIRSQTRNASDAFDDVVGGE